MAFCKGCGKQLRGDEKFCSSCGTPVLAEEGSEKKVDESLGYERYRSFQRRVRSPERRLFGAVWTGVFIIGLGILWYFDFWWPGILFLMGIMLIVRALTAYLAKM